MGCVISVEEISYVYYSNPRDPTPHNCSEARPTPTARPDSEPAAAAPAALSPAVGGCPHSATPSCTPAPTAKPAPAVPSSHPPVRPGTLAVPRAPRRRATLSVECDDVALAYLRASIGGVGCPTVIAHRDSK
jgi:hypothetical protein